jgi:uncharacterized protein YvpB
MRRRRRADTMLRVTRSAPEQRLDLPRFAMKIKASCGLVAVRMILASFGDAVKNWCISRSFGGLTHRGTTALKLGAWARKRGYQVECYASHKRYAGKVAQVKPPSRTDIRRLVEQGIPVIVNTNAGILWARERTLIEDPGRNICQRRWMKILWGKDMRRYGHFIVITAYKRGFVFYIDPLDGNEYKISEDEFLFAWLAKAKTARGYFLAIHPSH